eukprot:gene33624-45035_t
MTARVPLRWLAFVFAVSVACALVISVRAADTDERGLPLVRAYGRLEHKAHALFHAPLVTPDGLYYAGNQLALMEFDGRAWRILKIPPTYTRALALGPDGNFYVGDEDQLGLIPRPGNTDPVYRSLLDRVPADAKPFGSVRDVVSWRGDVFFATDKNILRFHPADQSFRAWPLTGKFRIRFSGDGDRRVLHRRGEGLDEFVNDTWQPLSRDPAFAAAGINGFVIAGTANTRELLIGLATRGLHRLLPDGTLAPWRTGADSILARTQVLTALRLNEGAIAIGTESEGLVILAADGKFERQISRESGLPHATVFALAEDRDGGGEKPREGGGDFGRRLQQALPLQDPRARVPASGGHGLPEPRPHAGRRQRDPGQPRYRVRGDRPVTPQAVAQTQLDSYNVQDLDGHCACFADDIVVCDLNGEPNLHGIDAYRARYEGVFAQFPQNHAELVARIVIGNTVIDHERVSRGPDRLGRSQNRGPLKDPTNAENFASPLSYNDTQKSLRCDGGSNVTVEDFDFSLANGISFDNVSCNNVTVRHNKFKVGSNCKPPISQGPAGLNMTVEYNSIDGGGGSTATGCDVN